MPIRSRPALLALAAALALPLAGCGGLPHNASLNSVHQPEVTHASVSLELVTTASATGGGSLSPSEQERLAAWFEAMHLRYGDKIAIADPLSSETARAGVADMAARFGVVLGDQASDETSGVAPGSLRVTLTRASAHVPHCPDWSGNSASNPANATSTNYGCAVNSNLAAMVADPDHLLKGASATGDTSGMTAEKAITAWRAAAPASSATAPASSSNATATR